MKVIVEFKLPEEEREHYAALIGYDLFLALDHILNNLRTKLKYQDLSEVEFKIYEDLRQEIIDDLIDRGISLEKLF